MKVVVILSASKVEVIAQGDTLVVCPQLYVEGIVLALVAAVSYPVPTLLPIHKKNIKAVYKGQKSSKFALDRNKARTK